jgi:hypothetical protein
MERDKKSKVLRNSKFFSILPPEFLQAISKTRKNSSKKPASKPHLNFQKKGAKIKKQEKTTHKNNKAPKNRRQFFLFKRRAKSRL